MTEISVRSFVTTTAGSVMYISLIKMAAIVVSLLIGVFLLPCTLNAAGIQVAISTPVNPVITGGILAIRCQVWNKQPNSAINIFRVTKTIADQITYGEDILRSSERPNMFLSIRTFSDGVCRAFHHFSWCL